MKKIKRWCLNKYVDLVFWWNKNKLEKQLNAELRPITNDFNYYGFYEDDTERKYAEGLATVKNKINSMTKLTDPDAYHNVLREVQDLISLGVEETTSQQQLRKTLTRLCALPEKSKKKMIEDRIEHYKELREHKEHRELLREIKRVRKTGNEELAQELESLWREKYGKIRNPR